MTVSAKDFREPVLRALGTLTNLVAWETVPRNQVVQTVLANMGITADTHGVDTAGRSNVEVGIGRAFNRNLKKRGLACLPKRNHWALTNEGAAAAAIMLGHPVPDPIPEPVPEPTPTLETEPAPVEPETETGEANPAPVPAASGPGGVGVSWTAFGEQETTYSVDPYIRGLAVDQTTCFGEFSGTSKVCGTCSLSGACKAMVLTRVSEIHARLTKRDEEARAAALRPKPDPSQPGPIEDDEDVDDIVSLIEGDDGDSHDIVENQDLGNGFTAIKVPAEALCRKCNKDLPRGMLVAWKRNDGMYHLACKL